MIRGFKVTTASKNPLHFGKRDKVVQLNLKDSTVSFTSYKPGHEKVKAFRCTSFTSMEKTGDKELSIKFDHDSGTYSKTLYFDAQEDRDHFCQLMQAICYSNGRAHRLFAELDDGQKGYLDAHAVDVALDELREVSMANPDWPQKLRERLTRKSAFSNSANVSAESGVDPERFLLAFVKAVRDDDFSSNGETIIKNDFAEEQKAAATSVSMTTLKPAQPEKAVGVPRVLASPTSGMQMMEAAAEEDGPEDGTELVALELLEGEQELLTQNHTSQILNTISSRGAFTLTTFRIVFLENRSGERWDTPLGNIARIDREDTLITIWCKDFRVVRFMFEAAVNWIELGLVKQIQRMAFPQDQMKTFAFSYTPKYAQNLPVEANGWNLYDPYKEYERLGFSRDDKDFRYCTLNDIYEFSPSYPRVFIVPTSVTDDELKEVARYRSKARIPAVVYRHPRTHAVMARCSQPMTGIRGKRCSEDEKLIARIREVNPTNNKVLYLIDARPYKAAVGNTVMGKGYENATNYKNTSLQFLNIDNIHVMRQSLAKLVELCNDNTGAVDDQMWHTKLAGTQWLYYVRLILLSAVRMVNMLTVEGASVVCHCSDGWDRTSQLCSLVLIMLDPYYRTRRGFAILIEEEWLSFGHRFAERYGQADPNHANDQRAPIFHQWVDAVWQLLRQFPQSFEFTEEYLLEIVDAVHSCQFGTFLFNCERERHENSVSMKSVSLWTYLCHDNYAHMFANPSFRLKRKMLLPDTSPKRIVLWERLYLRWDQNSRVRETEAQGRISLFKRLQSMRKAIIEAGLDINKFDVFVDEESKRPNGGKESVRRRPMPSVSTLTAGGPGGPGGLSIDPSAGAADSDTLSSPTTTASSPAHHASSSSMIAGGSQDGDKEKDSNVLQNLGRTVVTAARRVPNSFSPKAQLTSLNTSTSTSSTSTSSSSSSSSSPPAPSTPTGTSMASILFSSKPKAHGRTNSGSARLISPDRAMSPTSSSGSSSSSSSAVFNGAATISGDRDVRSPKKQPVSTSKTYTPATTPSPLSTSPTTPATVISSDLPFPVQADRTSKSHVGDSDAAMAQARAELSREMGKARSERQGSGSAPDGSTIAQFNAVATAGNSEPDYKICSCGTRNAPVKFCTGCGTNIEKIAVIQAKISATPRTGLKTK